MTTSRTSEMVNVRPLEGSSVLGSCQFRGEASQRSADGQWEWKGILGPMREDQPDFLSPLTGQKLVMEFPDGTRGAIKIVQVGPGPGGWVATIEGEGVPPWEA